MTEYTRKDKIFNLGGAGGYAIVPGKNTDIALELLQVCTRIEKINTIQKGNTWPEHRGGEPQYWQHRLLLYLDEDDEVIFSVESVMMSDDICLTSYLN